MILRLLFAVLAFFCWVALAQSQNASNSSARCLVSDSLDSAARRPSGEIASAVKEALAKFQSGNKADAIPGFQMAANHGHPFAQYALGLMYVYGDGLEKDESCAETWLRKSAGQAFAPAQRLLASLLQSKGEIDEAIAWYSRAAEAGDAKAQVLLGAIYSKGEDVPVDREKAIRLFQMAADQGDEKGKKLLEIERKLLKVENAISENQKETQAIDERRVEIRNEKAAILKEKCDLTYNWFTITYIIGPSAFEEERDAGLEYIGVIRDECRKPELSEGLHAYFVERDYNRASRSFQASCSAGEIEGCHFSATMAAFGDNPMMRSSEGIGRIEQYCSQGLQMSCKIIEQRDRQKQR